MTFAIKACVAEQRPHSCTEEMMEICRDNTHTRTHSHARTVDVGDQTCGHGTRTNIAALKRDWFHSVNMQTRENGTRVTV